MYWEYLREKLSNASVGEALILPGKESGTEPC